MNDINWNVNAGVRFDNGYGYGGIPGFGYGGVPGFGYGGGYNFRPYGGFNNYGYNNNRFVTGNYYQPAPQLISNFPPPIDSGLFDGMFDGPTTSHLKTALESLNQIRNDPTSPLAQSAMANFNSAIDSLAEGGKIDIDSDRKIDVPTRIGNGAWGALQRIRVPEGEYTPDQLKQLLWRQMEVDNAFQEAQPAKQEPAKTEQQQPAATPGAATTTPLPEQAPNPVATPVPPPPPPPTNFPASPDPKENVKYAQAMLEKMGLDTGVKNHKIPATGSLTDLAAQMDGVPGDHTKHSIENFKAAYNATHPNNQLPTGSELDRATLTALQTLTPVEMATFKTSFTGKAPTATPAAVADTTTQSAKLVERYVEVNKQNSLKLKNDADIVADTPKLQAFLAELPFFTAGAPTASIVSKIETQLAESGQKVTADGTLQVAELKELAAIYNLDEVKKLKDGGTKFETTLYQVLKQEFVDAQKHVPNNAPAQSTGKTL